MDVLPCRWPHSVCNKMWKEILLHYLEKQECSIAITWNNTWFLPDGECSDLGLGLPDFYKAYTNLVFFIVWRICDITIGHCAFFLTSPKEVISMATNLLKNILSLTYIAPFTLTLDFSPSLPCPCMNLAVCWCAVFIYIVQSLAVSCFVLLEEILRETEHWRFVFLCIQTKAGLFVISSQHLVTVHAFLNSMNIKWGDHLLQASCVPAQGLGVVIQQCQHQMWQCQ